MPAANWWASPPVLIFWLATPVMSGGPTICSRARSLRTWLRASKPTTAEPTPTAINTMLAAMPAYWKSLLMLTTFLSCHFVGSAPSVVAARRRPSRAGPSNRRGAARMRDVENPQSGLLARAPVRRAPADAVALELGPAPGAVPATAALGDERGDAGVAAA